MDDVMKNAAICAQVNNCEHMQISIYFRQNTIWKMFSSSNYEFFGATRSNAIILPISPSSIYFGLNLKVGSKYPCCFVKFCYDVKLKWMEILKIIEICRLCQIIDIYKLNRCGVSGQLLF